MSGGILLIGYGNPGRGDDGLGPALAQALEKLELPYLTVMSNYQLNVEDAVTVAAHDVVIFADAAVRGREPYSFQPVLDAEPLAAGYSTHSMEPANVMALARQLFGARTRGYTLGIRGYEFDKFGDELSPKARENLAAALRFVTECVRHGVFNGPVAVTDIPKEACPDEG
ncbi:MAG: hydrogenase maturation protease [Kiritimatiellae bacterium]|nr:hydrogenase maturation protease [Kiritimatiellia bacterium]